jgi:membrane dipeptidase
MMVDVAHLNVPGFWDVMRITDDPVVASHANAQGRCHHPRNLTDDQIRALAERGGTIHVTFTFLREDGRRPSLDDLLDHIEYIVNLVGPAHVGLGSDYDGLLSPPPIGLEDASRFVNITEGMLRRGFDADAVAGILGGNFLRVFKRVVAD